MGAFEARLKANARLRWIIPLGAGICVALVLAIWLFVSGRVDPVAARRHAEAMALVAQDDIESLEKAVGILDDVARKETGIRSIQPDRSLARILLATGLMEELAVPLQRLTAKLAERERIAAAQPPPSPEVLGTLVAEVEALRTVVEPRQSRARELSERAFAALKQLSADRGNEIEVARAIAVYFASIGDREQALRFIRTARGPSDRDPWMQLAEGWLDAREDAKEARERAVVKLAALVAARPDVVRARYLLARTQAALGWREAAAATLDGLLAANPRHRRASRMRAELVGAGGSAAAARLAPVPAGAPPALAPAPAFAPGLAGRPLAPGVTPTVPPKAPADGTQSPVPPAPAPRPAAPATPPARPASEATETNAGG
jgi:tetratricopeptide (TPR) repeat protein